MKFDTFETWQPFMPYQILLFYRFVPIQNPKKLVDDIQNEMETLGLLGRVLVAPEGINGTIAGTNVCVEAFVNALSQKNEFSRIDWKRTSVPPGSEKLPFLSISVRFVHEIISTGRFQGLEADHNIGFDQSSYGGLKNTGIHLSPKDFHHALNNNKGTIIDVRNDFEYEVGHFKNAVALGTVTYSETWAALDNILANLKSNDAMAFENEQFQAPIFMYCTGGIRCEKASAYLKIKGCANVFQLEGGIHRYFEEFPSGGNFIGKNFVFDGRLTVSPTDFTIENLSASAVGKCVYCHLGHDTYSGEICCTVCRQPVLCCEHCVQINPHPGEYHCFRHRHLKRIYFTVLEKFNLSQLAFQQKELEKILLEEQGSKNKRRTLRKQLQRISTRIQHLCHQNEDEMGKSSGKHLILQNPMQRLGCGFWQS